MSDKSSELRTRRSAIATAAARFAALFLSERAVASSVAPDPRGEVPFQSRAGLADLYDIIPAELRHAALEGNKPPEVTRFVRAGLASLGKRGGVLKVPGGTFRLAETIVLPRRVRIVGVGRTTSIFQIAHNGDAFRSEAPVNAFTPVNIGLDSLAIVCLDNRASNGAGFCDLGGTYVDLRDVLISGFKHGCVLDQSEIASLDLCQIEYAREAAVWLVNGPDRTSGARTTFTNRITVSRCQINQADGFGIIDDGGRAHSFRDNNFNGCRLGHLRLAGYGEYIVDGNYFEESGGTPIIVSNQTARGRNVQRPNSAVFTGNLIIAQSGRSSMVFEGATAVTLTGNTFVGVGAPSVRGLNTIETLASDANAVQNPAGLFEGTRAVRRHRSGELTVDHFERQRLAPVAAGTKRTLRIAMPDARPGDMPLVSFEPALALRTFMPVAQAGAVSIELENTNEAGSTSALDVLIRVRLHKA